MGSAAIPGQTIQSANLGVTTPGLFNAIPYLKVGGVVYANGYRVDYNNTNFRNYFAGYNPDNGLITLYCQVVCYNYTIPAETLNGVEVLLAD